MKVVVPDGVAAVSAIGTRLSQPRLLWLVFGADVDARPALSRRAARGFGDLRDDVPLRSVDDALGRVEAKAIESKLIDPVARVLGEELAHRAVPFTVEVERLAPLVGITIGEVIR